MSSHSVSVRLAICCGRSPDTAAATTATSGAHSGAMKKARRVRFMPHTSPHDAANSGRAVREPGLEQGDLLPRQRPNGARQHQPHVGVGLHSTARARAAAPARPNWPNRPASAWAAATTAAGSCAASQSAIFSATLSRKRPARRLNASSPTPCARRRCRRAGSAGRCRPPAPAPRAGAARWGWRGLCRRTGGRRCVIGRSRGITVGLPRHGRQRFGRRLDRRASARSISTIIQSSCGSGPRRAATRPAARLAAVSSGAAWRLRDRR